jgi:uncharacterized protein
MEISGERTIRSRRDLVWTALNDPGTLRKCIPGCQTFESVAVNEHKMGIALKIGPVAARFNASLKLSNVLPPEGYTLSFEGKGGIAGFGNGTANVMLLEIGQNTKLSYDVKANVGGKLAQLGSRLIDPAVVKLTEC